MPAPITAPTPSAVSDTGPNVRFSVCSPVALASLSSQSIGFLLNSALPIRKLLPKKTYANRRLFRSRRRLPCLLPKQIYRNAQQNDDQPRPSVLWLVTQKLNFDEDCHHQVKCRQKRIPERPIGSLHVRTFPAQNEKPAQREDVKNQHGENQKI